MTRQTSMSAARSAQQGITTIAITLILLVIISLMVIFSTNVGFFEQRTATNENRARIAQQAAEYALNLAGEYLKANRDKLISNEATGWLSTGTSRRWAACADVGGMAANHPCMAEPDATRRAQLYFWTSDGTTGGSTTLPYTSVIPSAAQVEDGMGGTADFPATTTVQALLCRLDTSDPANVDCALDPAAGNRIALRVVAGAALPNEGAAAEIKEAWATYSSFIPSAAVPLIASGLVGMTGNVQIVASPNAGGYGLPASIWAPEDVDIECTSGGCASVETCHIGDFLQDTPEAELKTTCITSANACGCSASSDTATTYLSGHVGSIKREREDVLDADGNLGSLPDIQFFPSQHNGVSPKDDDTDPTDDSLFEYTFNVDYVVADDNTTGITLEDCGDSRTQNCVAFAMEEEFSAEVLANCSSLDADSSGIYYITSGDCDPGNITIGTPDNPVIIVVHLPVGDVLRWSGNTNLYGMLFVHSDNDTAELRLAGTPTVVGSMIVEGVITGAGGATIIYDDTSITSDTHKLPKSAKFGRVPGSWLDARRAF